MSGLSAKELIVSWGLSSYYESLENEGYDLVSDWKDLTYDELIELGFKAGHAKRFMKNVLDYFDNDKKNNNQNNLNNNSNDNNGNDLKNMLESVMAENARLKEQLLGSNDDNNNIKNKENDNNDNDEKKEDFFEINNKNNNSSNDIDIDIQVMQMMRENSGNNYNLDSNNSNNNDDSSDFNNNKSDVNVSIVFLGETGVGKTTLLCSISDYLMNIKFSKMNKTPKSNKLGMSQTQQCTLKTIKGNGFCSTLIDTPGIGDTQGIMEDERHIDDICNFLGNNLEFNVICIVLTRGTTRATPKLKYVINEIKSNLPKDCKNNFIIALTRCDNILLPDSDTISVINELNLPTNHIFMINNSAYEDLYVSNKNSKNNENILKQANLQSSFAYHANFENIKNLLYKSSQFKPYIGKKIAELRIKRNELNNNVYICRRLINDSFKQESQLTILKTQLINCKLDTNKYKDFQFNKSIKYEVFEQKLNVVRTICSICGDHHSCHNPCYLPYGTDIKHCNSMRTNPNNNEIKCICNHNVEFHSHTHSFPIEKIKIISEIDQIMKGKYDDSKEKENLLNNEINKIENELNNVINERNNQIKKIQNIYVELESIAIIGLNHSFENYVKQCIKQIKIDKNLNQLTKDKQIILYNESLDFFKTLKSTDRKSVV